MVKLAHLHNYLSENAKGQTVQRLRRLPEILLHNSPDARHVEVNLLQDAPAHLLAGLHVPDGGGGRQAAGRPEAAQRGGGVVGEQDEARGEDGGDVIVVVVGGEALAY